MKMQNLLSPPKGDQKEKAGKNSGSHRQVVKQGQSHSLRDTAKQYNKHTVKGGGTAEEWSPDRQGHRPQGTTEQGVYMDSPRRKYPQ